MEKNERLKSLDAFRGFDMCFIMGMGGLITAICALFPQNGVTDWLAGQMEHVQWHGLAIEDMIFPTFLFIAGISFPFSIANQKAHGKTTGQIYGKIVRRGLVLVLLGAIYNGLLRLNFPDVRFASVLGRIGLAWMFAALLYVTFKTRVNIAVSVVILVGYWLLMWLVPHSSDPYSFDDNLVGAIDRVILPGRLHEKTFDPEGLFSTIPAIVTALLGMFTGQFVKLSSEKFSGDRKTLYMTIAGVALIIIGFAWSCAFPINKKLWTSTFVCAVAGISLVVFALFYYIIDVKGSSRWSFFFRVVGMNSITIYLAQSIIGFNHANNFIFKGIADKLPEAWGHLVLAAGYFAICWLFLYFLYKKKVFLKV
ncbi:MAG: DUF5009 domain-containing protein [Tannerella sp.]|jgi:predicted acyltransferase|nr:DUF5009 domain-containing protein [Tannerella sp.]